MPRWTNDDRKPLGKIRATAGYSRNEAAVKLHVGVTTLERYENGQNDVPFGVGERMAALYQVPFEDIRQAVQKTKELKGKE